MIPKYFTRTLFCAVVVQLFVAMAAHTADVPGTLNTPAKKSQAILWNQSGAKAGADYTGDGLSVAATAAGARLHCVFQRLDADATDEGLWLVSTVTNLSADRFRVMATAVDGQALSPQGTVTVDGQTARFTRAGLVEEYSVGVDGVRQDFLVTEKPAGDGELKVQLLVTGARVEQTTYGAQLVLETSGRKIAYSRLHATDANGKELPARIVAKPNSALRTPHSAFDLVVNDTGAVYPVRIDPTFSDANWVSMGGTNGVGGMVYAAVVDASANLYVGGQFTNAGNVIARNIAEWNGSSWSSPGSGITGRNTFGAVVGVYALGMSGGTLYAGGFFQMAGSVTAVNVAQWNGGGWSPLSGGVNFQVNALALSDGTLYAGGRLPAGSGQLPSYVMEWNGSNWLSLGSGMGNGAFSSYVETLAVSGTNLYAGGSFTKAGATTATNVAQWNGSSWLPLGLGMNGVVVALAMSGTNLYAGGDFGTAGGTNANYIAQWNGNAWSPLGAGMNGDVDALAVAGGTLYAGGEFTSAGGNAANYIAQWDGSGWSALGSGMNNHVSALAASGGTLYAGGAFTTAGDQVSTYTSEATIGPPTIFFQPQSPNVMAGGDADFSVGAEGQPLSYQWFKDGNGLSDGGNISGSASNSLLLTNLSVNDPGYYLVVVANNFGSVTSSVATLTVSNLPLALLGGQGNLGFTNDQFWLTVAGPVGSNVVVYASTNLQTWVPLATNPVSFGSLTFTDLVATNYLNRFYRAQLAP